jgi:DNA-binding response OmpR family regulator
LPRKQYYDQPAPAAPASVSGDIPWDLGVPSRPKHGSILLVEVEPAVRVTLKQVLEQNGYAVRTATTLNESLGLLHSQEYDAVITELNLDGVGSGLKVAAAAKSSHQPPVVIIYTGFPQKEQLRAALALRVDYLALKPVELDEITAALRTLILRRSMSRAMASA